MVKETYAPVILKVKKISKNFIRDLLEVGTPTTIIPIRKSNGLFLNFEKVQTYLGMAGKNDPMTLLQFLPSKN